MNQDYCLNWEIIILELCDELILSYISRKKVFDGVDNNFFSFRIGSQD